MATRADFVTVMLAACACVGAAFAGPLVPPSGPVVSTGKTLSEIEPRIAINGTNTPGDADSVFRITQPGSYYLTGNISATTGKMGIEIASANVTIDLQGFTISGGPSTLDGIATSASTASIVIRNGFITGFAGDGIDLSSQSAPASTVQAVTVTACGGNGVSVSSSTRVQQCVGYQNQTSGFNLSPGSSVSDSIAQLNSASGFVCTNGVTFTNCTAYQNGSVGINAGTGSIVSGCVARFNGSDGILALNSTFIKDCSSSNNGFNGDGAGIHITGSDCRVEGNNCTGSDRGIDVDSTGNFIVRNTCSGNATNWDVVANNVCLVVAATLSGAVTGNSGGTSPGMADPAANFTY